MYKITENDINNLKKLYFVENKIYELYEELKKIDLNDEQDKQHFKMFMTELKSLIATEDEIIDQLINPESIVAINAYIDKNKPDKLTSENIKLFIIYDRITHIITKKKLIFNSSFKMRDSKDQLLEIDYDQVINAKKLTLAIMARFYKHTVEKGLMKIMCSTAITCKEIEEELINNDFHINLEPYMQCQTNDSKQALSEKNQYIDQFLISKFILIVKSFDNFDNTFYANPNNKEAAIYQASVIRAILVLISDNCFKQINDFCNFYLKSIENDINFQMTYIILQGAFNNRETDKEIPQFLSMELQF